MKQAAQDLVNDVKTQILAKGGKYVAVMTLSDITDTPFGQSLPAAAQPVLTDLSQVFNLWLRDGLTGQPVQIIDTFSLFKTAYQNPAPVRLRQQHRCRPATRPRSAAITGGADTDGSSLFCNAHAGRALQRPAHRRRREHLAVRRQRAPDHRRPQGHQRRVHGCSCKAFGWI